MSKKPTINKQNLDDVKIQLSQQISELKKITKDLLKKDKATFGRIINHLECQEIGIVKKLVNKLFEIRELGDEIRTIYATLVLEEAYEKLKPKTKYCYQVFAVDISGNEGALSDILEVTTKKKKKRKLIRRINLKPRRKKISRIKRNQSRKEREK